MVGSLLGSGSSFHYRHSEGEQNAIVLGNISPLSSHLTKVNLSVVSLFDSSSIRHHWDSATDALLLYSPS